MMRDELAMTLDKGKVITTTQGSGPTEWPVNRYIDTLHQHLPELAEQYHVAWLGVFGSYVRNEQHEGSDLDLLVEFSKAPGLLKYVDLQDYLSDLLGVQVDLVMKSALRRRIGRRILEEVVSV